VQAGFAPDERGAIKLKAVVALRFKPAN